MGYPIEIANAIPGRRPPPPRSRLLRCIDRLLALLHWLKRRKRCRADAPQEFGQGVDPGLPPLTHADRKRLDFDEIARNS